MINVLLCIPSLKNQGAEKFVTELALKFNRNTINPVVIVTGILNKEENNYKLLHDAGINVYDASGKSFLKQVFYIVRILKKEKIDIIHSNLGSCLRMCLPNLLVRRVPHLFTIHSMGYRIFTGVKKDVVKFLLRTKRVIPIAICDTVKQSMVDTYRLPDKNIELVYNGVDTQYFRYVDRNEKAVVKFISVGALYYIKNYSFLLDAFSELVKYDANVSLQIIGSGEMERELRDKMKTLNLIGKVELLGNQNDVRPYLSDADVYCCCSLVEGMPLSVLEAMSTGLPVVTSAAGGVVDIVRNGDNGVIAKLDVCEYSKAMARMLDETFRRNCGLSSRKIAELRSSKNMVVSYEGLYKKYRDEYEDFKHGKQE